MIDLIIRWPPKDLKPLRRAYARDSAYRGFEPPHIPQSNLASVPEAPYWTRANAGFEP